MEFAAYLFLVAILRAAHASPVAQTTFCETSPSMQPVLGSTIIVEKSSSHFPHVLTAAPAPAASTTVCETSPGVVGLGYGHGYQYPYPAMGATVYESSPSLLPYGYVPYPISIPYGYGSNVYEPAPSVVNIVSKPSAAASANVGSSTVCETSSSSVPSPAVVSIQPYVYPQVSAGAGATTVCEYPYPGLLSALGMAPLGVALH